MSDPGLRPQGGELIYCQCSPVRPWSMIFNAHPQRQDQCGANDE